MRPIGKRIREACQILEEHGPLNCRQVQELMDDVEISNAHKYCMRAASHGLATVDKSVKPIKFAIVDNWRDKLKPKKRFHVEQKKPIINSVFSLGEINAP